MLPSYTVSGGQVFPGNTRVVDWTTGTASTVLTSGSTLDESTGMVIHTDEGGTRGAPPPGVTTPAWDRRDVAGRPPMLPVADHGRAYVAEPSGLGGDHHVTVLDAATGSDVWRGVVDLGSGELSRPAVRDGVAYTGVVTGPRSGELVVFGDCGADCPPVWTGGDGTANTSGGSVGPVVAGDLVFHAIAELDVSAGHRTGRVEVFAADGCGAAHCDPLATLPLDAPPRELLVSQGRVVVMTEGGLRVFGLP